MTYRNDLEALQFRQAAIEEKLQEIDRQKRELAGLETSEAQLRSQLRDVTHHRDAAERRQLPVLEEIRIATPCTARWEEMKGDETVRFCGSCEKNVYNIAAMSRAEAERLIYKAEGNLCVRMYRRHDGTVLTTDCPVGVRRRRRRRTIAAAAVAGAGLLAAATAAVAGSQTRDGGGGLKYPPVQQVMGAVPMGVPEMGAPPPPTQMGRFVAGGISAPPRNPPPPPVHHTRSRRAP